MHKKIYFLLLLSCSFTFLNAQEFNGKVTVNAQQISNTVDKTIFTNLQSQLNSFVNNRKWTDDKYQPSEKIKCNFVMNLQSTDQENVYKATLMVQATRPVYNSAYQSVLLNMQDGDIVFKYVQFQSIEFNDNRVQGNDPLTANLSAVFAYYLDMILAMEYDSFSPKGGESYFGKAMNIVNNAPESKDITGWKAFDGQRNRYWLAKNFTDAKYNALHDLYYDFYRSGLDYLYEDSEGGTQSCLDALTALKDFNSENANTMAAQVFVQGKSQEFIGIFKKANSSVKSNAVSVLSAIDISNASTYKQELK